MARLGQIAGVVQQFATRRGAVRVTGQDKLLRNLRALPIAVQRKHNKAALRAGGKIVKDQAKKNVKRPTKRAWKKAGRKEDDRRTGALGRSLVVKVIGRANKPYAGAVIGSDRKKKYERKGRLHIPGNISHLVEEGHGGPKPAPAYPFLRPAWETKKRAVQRKIASTLWKGIRQDARPP